MAKAASHTDPGVRSKARFALEVLRLHNLQLRWEVFASQSDRDMNLEDGAFLYAQVEYPELDRVSYQGRLDAMASDVAGDVARAAGPGEVVRVFGAYLTRLGFHGDREHYGDPENSFLNRVLDRKLGIPVTLGVVYLVLARRLHVPLLGIGFPGHFLIRYGSASTGMYVDPFAEGRVLTAEGCEELAVQQGRRFHQHDLEVVTDRQILGRMLRNLISCYADQDDHARMVRFQRYTQILELRALGDAGAAT